MSLMHPIVLEVFCDPGMHGICCSSTEDFIVWMSVVPLLHYNSHAYQQTYLKLGADSTPLEWDEIIHIIGYVELHLYTRVCKSLIFRQPTPNSHLSFLGQYDFSGGASVLNSDYLSWLLV